MCAYISSLLFIFCCLAPLVFIADLFSFCAFLLFCVVLSDEVAVDPLNPTTYSFLSSLLGEMSSYPTTMMHLGGTEDVSNCWNNNGNITKYMRDNGLAITDMEQLFWSNMTTQVFPAIQQNITLYASTSWTLVYPIDTFNDTWSQKITFQVDQDVDAVLPQLLSANYQAIISAPYNLQTVI